MFEVKFWSIVLLVAFAFTLRAKRCSFLLEFSVSCWQLNFYVITHFYQNFPNEFPFVARVFFYSYLYFEKIRNNIQLIRTIYPNNYARISVLCEIVFLKTSTEFLKNWNVRSKILARRRKIDFCFWKNQKYKLSRYYRNQLLKLALGFGNVVCAVRFALIQFSWNRNIKLPLFVVSFMHEYDNAIKSHMIFNLWA